MKRYLAERMKLRRRGLRNKRRVHIFSNLKHFSRPLFEMHFLELPEELILQILETTTSVGIQDYLQISLVNKQLRRLVYPLLHRDVKILLGGYLDEDGHSDRFARGRFLTEPSLGGYVRRLRIDCLHRRLSESIDIDAILDCLRVVPNLEELKIENRFRGDALPHKLAARLRSGNYERLTSLSFNVDFPICACRMVPFFLIPRLQTLRLGIHSMFEEGKCNEDHQDLLAGQLSESMMEVSSVTNLSMSHWTQSASLETLLHLPCGLFEFSGVWNPHGTLYSPSDVSTILSVHKDTLQRLHVGANIDKDDEWEPQLSDATIASFANFTALRELSCDTDIILDGKFDGAIAEAFADRLPPQLEILEIYNLPRLISEHAHKTNTSMESLDSSLVWLRSLARAKHAGSLALCKVTVRENFYLPGPLEGPYLQPIFQQSLWQEDEKAAWTEREPFPFRNVGIELEARLVFVVRGWTRNHPKKKSRASRGGGKAGMGESASAGAGAGAVEQL